MPGSKSIREYYLTEFRNDLTRFLPTQETPYFGHSWSYDCRNLENVVREKRAKFLLCLYFTVLADQAMHEHFREAYPSFENLTRYPKFCHGLGQFQKNPRSILSTPIDKGLVDSRAVDENCQDAMDLFVDEVVAFFRDHMPEILASDFFDKLIYDRDVQVPEIFVALDPTTKDRIEYKIYRALRQAVDRTMKF